MRVVRRLTVNGERVEVTVLKRTVNAVTFELGGRVFEVEVERSVPQSEQAAARSKVVAGSGASVTGGAVLAPIPGVIVQILVAVGDPVEAGQAVLRLEAMKMQNTIEAPIAGAVRGIHVTIGEEVGDHQLLAEIAPSGDT